MAVRVSWQGRYFEDFKVGDVYQHRLGRTITETDNAWFTMLTLNTNQMHFERGAQRAPAPEPRPAAPAAEAAEPALR